MIKPACLLIALATTQPAHTQPAHAGYGFAHAISHPCPLLGDPDKAKLGWVPQISFDELVA